MLMPLSHRHFPRVSGTISKLSLLPLLLWEKYWEVPEISKSQFSDKYKLPPNFLNECA